MVHPLWKQYGNPQKTKNRITVWSNNSTSGYISEENENTNSKRYRHPYVHVSIIYSNQDMETTEVSINRWMKTWYTCLCVCVYVHIYACVHAKSLQLCLTLDDPMDWSPPGTSVHEILQARVSEWVSMPSCRGSSWPRDWTTSLMSHTLADGFFTSDTWKSCTHTHTHTHTHTMEYYSVVKRSGILPFAMTWMNLESIILSEISLTEKGIYCILLMHGI